MESHHAGVPLIFITADRPRELRGVGANQTTDQVGIFGTFVRWSADIAAPADGEPPGRATRIAARAAALATGDSASDEPRSGAGSRAPQRRVPRAAWRRRRRVARDGRGRARLLRSLAVGHPGRHHWRAAARRCRADVVIAGDGAGDAARIVAEAHGWPLLAEPTSGARTGSRVRARVRSRARHATRARELADTVDLVVVIGRPTLTRGIQALIADAPALYVAAHGARWREAPLHARQVLPRVPQSVARPPRRNPR